MKRKLKEFPVTGDALLPVGMSLGVRHFVPGQYVDVTGITRGKGFQGGMKRWVSKECLHLMVRHYLIEVLVLLARGMLLARYLKAKRCLVAWVGSSELLKMFGCIK